MKSTENEIKEIFKSIDRDNNGFIDAVELYGAFSSNGIAITEKEVKKMIGNKSFLFYI